MTRPTSAAVAAYAAIVTAVAAGLVVAAYAAAPVRLR